jgi:hypothetical protein
MFLINSTSAKLLREIGEEFNDAYYTAINESKMRKCNMEVWHIGFDGVQRKLTTIVYQKNIIVYQKKKP